MGGEDVNVTGKVEGRGEKAHRSAKVKGCENGFIVEYNAVEYVEIPESHAKGYHTTQRRTRVFLIISDVLEFLNDYFSIEHREETD